MPAPSPHEVTQLLHAWRQGDETALEQLFSLVESELRSLAQRYLSRERPNHTLQTTALINEAYLRLQPQQEKDWQNRAHFIGVAAQVMRQVLVEYARHRNAEKGPGRLAIVSLDELNGLAQLPMTNPPKTDQPDQVDVIALDEALIRLSADHLRHVRIVEMRFFGGLTIDETAEALAVNKATVVRDWKFAKAWLYRELNREDADGC